MKLTRTFDILPYLKEKHNRPDTLSFKESGQWRNYSTDEVIDIINNFSYGLLSAGIKKGDKVAIISANRPEWNFVDLACAQIGVITVPMYPSLSSSDMAYILNDAGVRLLFLDNAEIGVKINEIKDQVPSLEKVSSFDALSNFELWTKYVELGKQNPNPKELKNISDSIEASDLLTLIYTSGTTGLPKGVMLSHNNIMSNAKTGVDDVAAVALPVRPCGGVEGVHEAGFA